MSSPTEPTLKMLKAIFAKEDKQRTPAERDLIREVRALIWGEQLNDRTYLIGLALSQLVETFKKKGSQRTKEEELLVHTAYDVVEQESARAAGSVGEFASHRRRH